MAQKKYFKHYENADDSEFVQKVIKKLGLVGYAQWMLLLELMVSKYNGKSILIRLTVQEVATKLRIKSSRSHFIISQFSELSNNEVITKLESNDNQANFDGFIIIISAPILSDLQAKDFGRQRSVRAKSAPRLEIEDNKIKDEEIAPTSSSPEKPKEEIQNGEDSAIPSDILSTIKTTMQYPDEIIEEVRVDAWLKYLASDKHDKSWRRFIGNYFHNEKTKIQNMMLEKIKGAKKQNSGLPKEMATKIYNQIVRAGRDGVKEILKGFSPIEIQALDRFGLASEIYNCPNEFAANDLKKRLNIACEAVVSEQEISA